jgi:hypothetical protein
MTFQQFIPKSVEALNMPDFRDPLTVGSIGFAPVFQRADIKDILFKPY